MLMFGEQAYPHIIRSGPTAREDLAARFSGLDADAFILVTSEGMPDALLHYAYYCLGKSAPVIPLPVPAGEKNKTIEAIGRMADKAIANGATRRSVVVAFGGGLAGNMAGLLAALLFRGIRLVHVPTTLLAAADSTPSLKQAVNSGHGKNHIGTFYPPEFVWTSTEFFEHLPPVEIRSALGEVIKAAVAITPDRIPALHDMLRPDADYTTAELAWIADLCLAAKQEVMLHDPHEKGPALALEYGHTTGHVFELVHRMPHGLAISVGGLVAARVAEELGFLDPSVRQLHTQLLVAAGAPVTVPSASSAEQLRTLLLKDNKLGYLPDLPGHVAMVLLAGLGELHQPAEARRIDGHPVPLTQVPVDLLLQCIRTVEQAA
jgi:3-dehydroquinate synthase/2-deoxy-scyllo-inosose synthase